MKIFTTTTAEETEQLAAELLPAILNKKVVLLSGPLGSGKTTFVKGLAKALKVKKAVTSPTYAYVNAYALPVTRNEQPANQLFHFDLYRLPENTARFPELEEVLEEEDALIVVEWPERIPTFSCEAVVLKFEKQDVKHVISMLDS